MKLSKNQIDKLGERLRAEVSPTDADLTMLDAYRRSFSDAMAQVENRLPAKLLNQLSSRRAKSTASIVQKLRRESVRLSQIQDIAGFRILVDDLRAQDRLCKRLVKLFPENSRIVDRRPQPQHGYRAVHVVVTQFGHPVELQIRTRFQHLWAEMSEGLADQFGQSVKYGGGPALLQQYLAIASSTVEQLEINEVLRFKLRATLAQARQRHAPSLTTSQLIESGTLLAIEMDATYTSIRVKLEKLMKQALS